MSAKSRSWTWLWENTVPDFAGKLEEALGSALNVSLDWSSLDGIPEPRQRIPGVLSALAEAIRTIASPETSRVIAPVQDPSRAPRLVAERRGFLLERINTVKVRGGIHPEDPVLQIIGRTLVVSVPRTEQAPTPETKSGEVIGESWSFPGCGAQDFCSWFETSLDLGVMALLRKVQHVDFPRAQYYFQELLESLIHAISLGEDRRSAMRERLASDGVKLVVDWQSFTSLENQQDKLAALGQFETGVYNYNRYGDVFTSLFYALREKSRLNPEFLWRFLQHVRVVRFQQSQRAGAELFSTGSTLVVSQGMHDFSSSEEALLDILDAVVFAMLPSSIEKAIAEGHAVEVRRRQLEEILDKPLVLEVGPVFAEPGAAYTFLSRRVLALLVGVIQGLVDRPEYASLIRNDLESIRIEPVASPVKPGCAFEKGALTIRWRLKREGFDLLEPGELARFIDDAMLLLARSRIAEVERDERGYWEGLLREAFGREVGLDVDWDSFLAHPIGGGNLLNPLNLGQSGVRDLIRALTGPMKKDQRFRQGAQNRIRALRVTAAEEASAKDLFLDGDALVYRCYADATFSGYLGQNEIEKRLFRLLARQDNKRLAYSQEELYDCLRAIVEDEETLLKDTCETRLTRLDLSEERRPISMDEDAVEVRVTYDYGRGEESGTFTEYQLYRWFPNGELQRVFSRVVERTCEWRDNRWFLKGEVETSGRMGGPGLKHTRVYVSLHEVIEFAEVPGEAATCKTKEEYVWADGKYEDTWLVMDCRLPRDEILDLVGLARPLHSILGHELRVRTVRGWIAALVDVLRARELFLLTERGGRWELAGAGRVVEPMPAADRFLPDPQQPRKHRMGQPYLYPADPIFDLGEFGMGVVLSCAYSEGRAVQLYRCSEGRIEEVLFYNLEHRSASGNYLAALTPVEGEKESIPHFEVRGTLTQTSGAGGPASETSFLRTFGWNGRCYVARCERDEGLPSGQRCLGSFSTEEVLRSIYGIHFAVVSELGIANVLRTTPAGKRHAVLVERKRGLFVVEEQSGVLKTVAGTRLPELERLDDVDHVSVDSLHFTTGEWRVSDDEVAIGIECRLTLRDDSGPGPLVGHGRWLLLFLHREDEESLELILQAPLERHLSPSLGEMVRGLFRKRSQTEVRNWRARLEAVTDLRDQGYFRLRLAGPRGRSTIAGHVFRWNGRRYFDSVRLATLAADMESEMRRLKLWQVDTGVPAKGFRTTTPAEFPAWLQFSLLPELRALSSVEAPIPDVRGLAEVAHEALPQHRAGLLRQLISRVEIELCQIPKPRIHESPPVTPGVARLQRGILDRPGAK
jgi:uncharacterized protein YqcC (DUF446 family)